MTDTPLSENEIETKQPLLTIGMTTYDDYDGVYFSIQAIRINSPNLIPYLEFVVIDNNPKNRPVAEALKDLGNWVQGYRYIPRDDWTGTAMRNAVFENATAPCVLCMDCHVLFYPGAISRLIQYFANNPGCKDLLQGPLVYDDLHNKSTHFDPVWGAGMFGQWGTDDRGLNPNNEPFEIPMQGLGVFACFKDAWLGFNPNFRGFGGEEFYIHEKYRQAGHKTLCLPFLQWVHRFGRPQGQSFPNNWEERIRNYMIGWTELKLPTQDIENHFRELLGQSANVYIKKIRRELNLDK